jgi:hypothetical protein
MKRLLIVTSFLEGSTGLALIVKPSLIVLFLLGSPLANPLSVIITRIAGVALVSLAIVCWFSRKSNNMVGVTIALLFYNLASVVLLGYAGVYESLNGVALWPAVAAHIAMTLWCAMLLYRNKPEDAIRMAMSRQ